MKGRDSGMPAEEYWETFFDAEAAVARLFGEQLVRGDVVDFGCGYGTFTLAAARRTAGIVNAFDIDPVMIAAVRRRAERAKIGKVRSEERDFMAHGTGLPAASQSHAMIYNLLHLEDPVSLLKEAHCVLREDGWLSAMPWRGDIPTPRGPPLAIRPTPEQCGAWIAEAGFGDIQRVDVEDCCPYHYALTAIRPA